MTNTPENTAPSARRDVAAKIGAAGGRYALRHTVRPEDPARVERLVTATAFFNPEEVIIARELVDTYLQQGPASGYEFLFAEQEGDLLGYGCWGEIPMTDRRFDLYWIAAHPTAQGLGLGSRLLAEVERCVAAVGGHYLYAETSSRPLYVPTQGFYAARGYALAARLVDFYHDGDDKLIYRKRILGAC